MSTRLEVEASIKQMSTEEIRDLAKWLQEYLDDMWDQQLTSNLETGKLDRLIAKVESDIAANRVRDLDEVLYNS
jgi:hypothetical protein